MGEYVLAACSTAIIDMAKIIPTAVDITCKIDVSTLVLIIVVSSVENISNGILNIIIKMQDTIRKLDVVIMKFLKYLICFFTYRLMLTNIFICHTPVDGERLLHQK